jgi:hypothetical protein
MSSSIGSQEIGQIIQQILPLANDPKHLDEFKNHFEVLFNHLESIIVLNHEIVLNFLEIFVL